MVRGNTSEPFTLAPGLAGQRFTTRRTSHRRVRLVRWQQAALLLQRRSWQRPARLRALHLMANLNIGIPAGNVGAYTKAEVNNLVNARGAKSTASLGVNGWHRDGDTGFIMQWGQVGGGVGNVAITFPIPFPNACLGMSNTVIGGGGELNWSTVRSTSRTGATIGRDSGAFWQAWGN